MNDTLAIARTRITREVERLGALPAPRLTSIAAAEWPARAEAAGLLLVFDTDGRPSPPSDDELYDAIEAQRREDPAAAERFRAWRPARRSGPPPTWNGLPPDPLRRGPPTRAFEIRVAVERDRCVLVSLRARHHGDQWAMLSQETTCAAFRNVPDDDFAALVTACDAVFGAGQPRSAPRNVEERWRLRPRRGSRCARCDAAIEGWAACLEAVGLNDTEVVQLDLECAHAVVPVALSLAARDTAIGDPGAALGSLLRVAPGSVARCEACRGIVPKGTWRAERVLVTGVLHLECAARREPTGLRRALDRGTELPDADAWRAQLDARRPP